MLTFVYNGKTVTYLVTILPVLNTLWVMSLLKPLHFQY